MNRIPGVAVSWVAFSICFARVAGATPAQIVIVDTEYEHSEKNTKDSHFRVKPAPGAPADWRRPVPLAAGTAYMQLEILSKPTDTPTRFQICFEATPGYACTSQSPSFLSTGVVTWSTPFTSFFQYDRVDWTQGVHDVALILKDTKNVKPATENVGAEVAARYLPVKLRAVVTLVPPGGEYQPPATRTKLGLARLESPAEPEPPAQPQLAFPGQYALPPADLRYPAWPKGCGRFVDPIERASCFEYTASNFGSLSRYAGANAELLAAAKDPKGSARRVVFFGDSITDGWSKPNSGGFFPGRPYVNRGIGGQTTAQMLVRFAPDVLELHPRAVLILAGTNDVAGNSGPATTETIEGNLAAMAQLARANGIRTILASLLPVCDGKRPQVKDRPPETIRTINKWMAEHARKNGYVFADYHAAMAGADGLLKGELTEDCLHPNAAGYAVMAPIAQKAIDRALGR